MANSCFGIGKERTRLWSRSTAQGDRTRSSWGGGGIKETKDQPHALAYHHRRKYVRAAQGTARDGRFPPRRALPLLGGFVVCPAVRGLLPGTCNSSASRRL